MTTDTSTGTTADSGTTDSGTTDSGTTDSGTAPVRIFLDTDAITATAQALARDAGCHWGDQSTRLKFTGTAHLALTTYLRNTTPPGVFTTAPDA
ncbi:hypothetical protein [Saccharothrix sp. HUAS TT1]|uniref:hypothetical protein n=1 Tax=unclassified Saccharothrix TaxID=2593673 RepID=UPI00345BD543